MASHLDLEEQEKIDELKHFWQRYGDWITWTVTALMLAYAGWKGWDYWQQRQAVQAAALYDVVERAAASNDLNLLERSVSDIEKQFGRTTQAQQAALLSARLFLEGGQPERARQHWQWVIDNGQDPAYQALARLRLAGQLIQEKSLDEARKVLTATSPEAFAPLLADRLGDLEMLQGQADAAKQQYLKAWRGLDPQAEYRRLVAVKLAALGADPEANEAEVRN